jgi:hypothetical protein
MRLAILTAAALLAGCAVPASQVSNVELCRYALFGSSNDQVVAEREARRRGLDCAPLYGVLLQKRQQEAAALNNAAQFFNRPAAPAQGPVTCDSYRLGNRVETTCHR